MKTNTVQDSAVLRIAAVEYFSDFGNDDGPKAALRHQRRKPVTEDFEEEGNAF